MKKGFSLPLLLFAVGLGLCGALGLTLYVKENPALLAQFMGKATEETQTAEKLETLPRNEPPRITWTVKPEAIAEGRVRMAYQIEASAPVTAVRLHITPVVKLTSVAVETDVQDVPLYMTGRKSLTWDGHMDLTGSLLAGSPVTLRVEVEDKDKRQSMSDEHSITLPERSFANPVAKTIYTMRKTLMQEPQAKRLEVLRALASVLQQREHFKDQNLILLTLRSAAVRIALDKTDEGLVSALELLWHAALMFEENTVRVAVKF